MKTQFEQLFEEQKKVMDLWTENVMKMVPATIPHSSTKSNGHNVWTEWMDNQNNYWKEILNNHDLKDAFTKLPEQMQEWAKAQTEWSKKWMDFYNENSEKLGFKSNNIDAWMKTDGWKNPDWATFMEKGNEWMKSDWMNKLPQMQLSQFNNFKELYDTMGKNWEQIQKMIEFGLTNWEVMNPYFSSKSYEESIGKLFGFKPIHNLTDIIHQSKSALDKYLQMFKKMGDRNKTWTDQWPALAEKWTSGDFNQSSLALLEVFNRMREDLDMIQQFAPNSDEKEINKLISDVSYAYTAYLMKAASYQHTILEASKKALPATINEYFEKFKNEKSLPDYQGFMLLFAQHLEHDLLKLFHSKEYTDVQNDMLHAGIAIKSKMDDLVKHSVKGTPFLTTSFSDEVSMEIAALRKKLRDLEAAITPLEAKTKVTEDKTKHTAVVLHKKPKSK